MVLRYVLFTCLLAVLPVSVLSQTFEERFAAAWESGDTKAQKNLLNQWETKEPHNPEFYISAFNFHFRNSKEEILNVARSIDGKPLIELKDIETEETAGFISSKVVFEPESVRKALGFIEKGIEKFPDRLDMRFGQIDVLRETGDFQEMTKIIVAMVDRSSKNENRWAWRNGDPIDDPKEFMLGNIQTYVGNLFDATLDNARFIKQIAEGVLRYYPNDVRFLSNQAVYHMIMKEYDQALIPLLKAEKIATEDPVILGNIAYSYFEKGDKPKAIIYYRKFYKYGDESAKAQAREKIEELGEKP